MGFADSGWVAFQPITLLFGRNSSGKSARISALLLLRQSLDREALSEPLLFVKDDGCDVGDYAETVIDHDINKDLSFWFRIRFQRDEHAVGDAVYFQEALRAINTLVGVSDSDAQTVTVRLIIGLNAYKSTELKGIHILNQRGDIIFRASKNHKKKLSFWKIKTDLFELDDPEFSPPSFWDYVEMFNRRGFLPWIRPRENIHCQFMDRLCWAAAFFPATILLRCRPTRCITRTRQEFCS